MSRLFLGLFRGFYPRSIAQKPPRHPISNRRCIVQQILTSVNTFLPSSAGFPIPIFFTRNRVFSSETEFFLQNSVSFIYTSILNLTPYANIRIAVIPGFKKYVFLFALRRTSQSRPCGIDLRIATHHLWEEFPNPDRFFVGRAESRLGNLSHSLGTLS